MAGGIEQQIQQRMDAYRGNPQRLMQKYQQSQELLDLLALQKLKSEKEAAARQMQMQMQQAPQTVKQQREAELMQMTKDELTANVGKTMQQQQAKSQNNIRRVAQAGIPTAPAPNMARMAGGGIVGFSAGDTVVNPDTYVSENFGGSEARARARFQELENKGRGSVRNLTPAEAREFEILRGKFEETPIRDALESGISSLVTGAKDLGTTLTTPRTTLAEMGTDDEDPYADQPEIDTRPPVPTEDETDYLDPQVPAEPSTPAPAPETSEAETPASPFENLQTRGVNIPESNVGSLDASKYQVKYDDSGLQSLQKTFEGMSNIDKDKVRETGYTSAMGKIDYTPEERKGLEALIEERKGLEARRMDPKALRREQLSSFFRGAANRSGIGSTLAGASAGAAKARGAQQQAEMALLEGRQKEIKDLIEKSRGIRKESYEYGTKDREEAGRDIRAGLEGQFGISKEQADRAEGNADRLLKVDAANLDAETAQRQMELKTALQIADQEFTRDIKVIEGSLSQQKIDAQKAYNEAMVNSNDKRYAENALVNINKTIGDITGAYDDMYNERISNVQSGLVPGFKDKADIDAEVARLRSQRNSVLTEALKDLRDQQARLDDVLTSGLTATRKSP